MKNEVSQIKKRFAQVEEILETQAWFKKEKWIISIHEFPNDRNPEGVTFQVFKKHWWNETRQGLHIESYLDIDQKKQKKTYVTLHLLHSKLIPGTQLKREALSKPFVDAIHKDVCKWEGYKFRAGKYGTQPFAKFLDGTASNFEKELAVEVSQICTKLGPILEKCIKEMS